MRALHSARSQGALPPIAKMSRWCRSGMFCSSGFSRDIDTGVSLGLCAGSIPAELGRLTQTTSFDLRHNQLSGENVARAMRVPGYSG